jgi:curved DNA-binding protein CbpA
VVFAPLAAQIRRPRSSLLVIRAIVGRLGSIQQIRAACLALVKELHPDGRELDPIASERLKAINKAYQDLKAKTGRAASRPLRRGAGFGNPAPYSAWLLGSSRSLLALAGGVYYARELQTGEPTRPPCAADQATAKRLAPPRCWQATDEIPIRPRQGPKLAP